MDKLTIFWFRRDLRLSDNTGLYHALLNSNNVLPVFIFDRRILSRLDNKDDARISFIYQAVSRLKTNLEKTGSSLLVLQGDPVAVFQQLSMRYSPAAIYTNHDYEPDAVKRDEEVRSYLSAKGIDFRSFKDQCIFEKEEVLKSDGKPYTVFTPYMRAWKRQLDDVDLEPLQAEEGHFHRCKPMDMPSLQELGFEPSSLSFPDKEVTEELLKNYQRQRDFPAIAGTSRISVHLRFGTISIRQQVKKALECSEVWLNELIWRDFYMMILWHFPGVVKQSFRPAYDFIKWRNNEEEFDAWCRGETGYPIVDAGMRELNQTGFMHNRLRMITASFLSKHLLIDWRWGEAYFAEKLLDFELSSNNGGWQWAAGSGCDAAPYFRIFNPALQTQKFDPDQIYIQKWVPEFQELTYPHPLVDHKMARERALRTYREALDRHEQTA